MRDIFIGSLPILAPIVIIAMVVICWPRQPVRVRPLRLAMALLLAVFLLIQTFLGYAIDHRIDLGESYAPYVYSILTTLVALVLAGLIFAVWNIFWPQKCLE